MNTKKCNKCERELPIDCFHTKKKNKIQHICKDCMAQWQKAYYTNVNKKTRLERQSKDKYQRYIWEYKLLAKYGITLEDYENKLKEQDGCCAICGSKDPCNRSKKKQYFCIDHDHATGKVRGLLCGLCNSALGFVREQEEILNNMILYIQRYKDNNKEELPIEY